MAHTSVSACVLSIVASFSSGLDVCRKLREKRRRRKHGRACEKLNAEEHHLTKSLRQAPEDIGREYQRNMQAAGGEYAFGDAAAQTSLAEILLKLNTGLVGIIASFVNRDRKDVQLDYESLTMLSEASRVNTCETLRQLCRRMLHPFRPLAVQSTAKLYAARDRTGKKGSDLSSRSRKKSASGHAKPRGPMLARVTIQNSSKSSELALVKSSERRKATNNSSSRRGSDTSKQHSETKSHSRSSSHTAPPAYTAHESVRPHAHRSHTQPEMSTVRAHHSRHASYKIPSPPLPPKSEALRPSKSAPRLHILQQPTETLPSNPPSAPPPFSSEALPLPKNRHRKPTPTYYSTASAGTKLGEIPLHHWPEPPDFDRMSLINREAERNGWPANQLQGFGEQQGRREKKGFWRLFGRKGA